VKRRSPQLRGCGHAACRHAWRIGSLQRLPGGVGRPSIHGGPPERGGGARGASTCGSAGSTDGSMAAAGTAAGILFFFLLFFVFKIGF
jgi:hypothetical protein